MRIALVFAPTVVLAAPLPSSAQPEGPLAVNTLLPANTAFTVLINTKEATWEQLTQFQLFSLIEDTRGQGVNPGGLPFVPGEIDYQGAIGPWVGDEVALALLPPSPSQSADMADQWLMAAPIANPDRFEGFIDQVISTQENLPTEQVYNGVSILTWEPQTIVIPPNAEDGSEELELNHEPPHLIPPHFIPLASFLSPKYSLKRAPISALPDQQTDFEIEIEPAEPSLEDETIQEPGLAIAVLPGHLVMAYTPGPIQQLIDSQLANTQALADHPSFQRTLANPDYASSLVVLYGSLLELNQFSLARNDLPIPDLPIPLPSPVPQFPLVVPDLSEDLTALAQVDATLESFVRIQSEGIGVQARVYPNTPNPAFATPDVLGADQILSLLPAPTYMLASGRDLTSFWNQIVQFLESHELTRNGLEQVRMMVTGFTGLDLDSDIFGWMDGEHALALFPTRQGVISGFDPAIELGIGVMIQTSDRPTADATFETVEDLLLSMSLPVSIDSRTVNGEPVVSWGAASNLDLADQNYRNSYFSRGWVTDDTLAITDGIGSMAELMNPQPYEPLRRHSTFRTATQSFPRPNHGYFYINMGSILSLIYNALDLDSENPTVTVVKQFLGSFYSFSATTSSTADYAQVDFLAVLAPTEN
ncbi:MAG: DUF3352 domain-containing protein [Leptolyngbyaceae cyanobacterium MO_188.B28]|nr:DUF3352 domain-containing protein [Leptolyngbyaceae cyanobacterium MO_188.B28]